MIRVYDAAGNVIETHEHSIESAANVDCSELTVLRPWLSKYVDAVLEMTGVLVRRRRCDVVREHRHETLISPF